MVLFICLDFEVISLQDFLLMYLLFFSCFLISSQINCLSPKKAFSSIYSTTIFWLTNICFYFYWSLFSASLQFIFPFLTYNTQSCCGLRDTVKCIQRSPRPSAIISAVIFWLAVFHLEIFTEDSRNHCSLSSCILKIIVLWRGDQGLCSQKT